MTYHSIIRAEERMRSNEKSARRRINRAKERGIEATAVSSRERRYLESKETDGKHAVYYAGYCFILGENNCCITMYPVPAWFGKKRLYHGKEQIKHPKKYFKYNIDSYERLYV